MVLIYFNFIQARLYVFVEYNFECKFFSSITWDVSWWFFLLHRLFIITIFLIFFFFLGSVVLKVASQWFLRRMLIRCAVTRAVETVSAHLQTPLTYRPEPEAGELNYTSVKLAASNNLCGRVKQRYKIFYPFWPTYSLSVETIPEMVIFIVDYFMVHTNEMEHLSYLLFPTNISQ